MVVVLHNHDIIHFNSHLDKKVSCIDVQLKQNIVKITSSMLRFVETTSNSMLLNNLPSRRHLLDFFTVSH